MSDREALADRYMKTHGDSQTRADFLAGWDAASKVIQAHTVVSESPRDNEECEWACAECGWAFGWWRPSDHGPDVANRRNEHLLDVVLRAASEASR